MTEMVSQDRHFIRRGLILVFIALLLDIIGIALIAPVMPIFLSELTGDSISKASVDGGYLLMVYSTMQFIFAPLVGSLSDRFGRRPILLISILTLALDNLICALAAGYWMLFTGRILAGISGASFATCSAFIADISDHRTRTRNLDRECLFTQLQPFLFLILFFPGLCSLKLCQYNIVATLISSERIH